MSVYNRKMFVNAPQRMKINSRGTGITSGLVPVMKANNGLFADSEEYKKLYEIADFVIDNCVPSGDSIIPIGKDFTGAVSTILGCFIVNLIVTESLKLVQKKGKKLPLFYSQNIDGISNEELFSKYENRVKHL